jgi:hypothetical protein
MPLQVIGAGLPRTATTSLGIALEQLLGGPRHHMSAIPNHPFDLGEGWSLALAGGTPDWEELFAGYIAAVDWPASAFWRDLIDEYPNAPVLLSVRDSAQTWYESMSVTVIPAARLPLTPGWSAGRHLVDLFERFTGATEWDDPATLMAAYERHNAAVRATVAPDRLLEWNAKEGWEPLCHALGKPVPDQPFPWVNKKEDWG